MGSLERNFKHMPIELFLTDNNHKVKARMYFAKSKQLSMLRSVCSHIRNLFDGVTSKFEYRMRLVYAHFLGEKRVRTVNMLPGVKVDKSTATKDELVVTGTDIDLTSRSAALIRQSCLVKDKDIRKFLDG